MESPEPVVLNSPGSNEKGINDCFYVLFFYFRLAWFTYWSLHPEVYKILYIKPIYFNL